MSSYLETSASSVASISSSVADSIHDGARNEALHLRRSLGRRSDGDGSSSSSAICSTNSSLAAASKLQKLTAQFDAVFSQEATDVVRQIQNIEGRLGKLREARHPLDHDCTLMEGGGLQLTTNYSKVTRASSSDRSPGGDLATPMQNHPPSQRQPLSPGEPFLQSDFRFHEASAASLGNDDAQSRVRSQQKTAIKSAVVDRHTQEQQRKLATLERAVADLKKENQKVQRKEKISLTTPCVDELQRGWNKKRVVNAPASVRATSTDVRRSSSPTIKSSIKLKRSMQQPRLTTAHHHQPEGVLYLPLDAEVSSTHSSMDDSGVSSSGKQQQQSQQQAPQYYYAASHHPKPPRAPQAAVVNPPSSSSSPRDAKNKKQHPTAAGVLKKRKEVAAVSGGDSPGMVHSGSPIVAAKVRTLSVQLRQLDRTQTQQEALLQKQRRTLDSTVQSLDTLHNELSCRRYIDPATVRGTRSMSHHQRTKW